MLASGRVDAAWVMAMAMAMAKGRTIIVAGAGDVGGRLAQARAMDGDEVVALRRRSVDDEPGLRWISADLLTGNGLQRLPRQPDAVVFCASPDQRTETAYRALFIEAQQRLADALGGPPARWLFVSSTAVHGEDRGAWVDEASAAEPQAFNGRVLIEAERRLGASVPGTVVLRPSGIYGPGRDYLLRRARREEPARPRWTNRVHVEDVASALSHLLDLADPEPLYLCNDDLPAREDEVLSWLRGRMGLGALATVEEPESGRRVSNARLRGSGWAPRWPDYRSGYGALLA